MSRFKIVAIVDENIHAVLKSCPSENIHTMLKETILYADDSTVAEESVYTNHDFELSIIASRNDKHFDSLILANRYNKNIFCEKPIVHKNELIPLLLKAFATRDTTKLFFQTGLVLRYSEICRKAPIYLAQIGQLKSIKGVELLDIGHGGQIIEKGWRKSRKMSGGLGIEKCVHDYDMIMHFIERVFIIPINHVDVISTTKNTFWIPERREEIMNKIENNPELFKSYHKWDHRQFQRLTDDPFEVNDDSIPDQQEVYFNVHDPQLHLQLNQTIPIEFSISAGGFRSKTERWYHFYGTLGSVKLDMVNLTIITNIYHLDQSSTVKIGNRANDSTDSTDSHAGGDYAVMETLVRLLTKSQIDTVVSFDEVIRSTVLGCLAEDSANNKQKLTYRV